MHNILIACFSYSFSIFGFTRFLTLDYPHFEPIVPILLTASLYFFGSKKISLCIVFGTIACSFREDAGIHAFLIYTTLFINSYFCPRYKNCFTSKISIKLAFLFATYSLLGIFAQKLIKITSNNEDNAFERIYSGVPAFEHINLHFLFERAFALSHNWQISIPFLILIFLAFITKNNYFILGYISCLPWTIIGIMAKSNVAGNFELYYAFPFLLAMLSPFAIIGSNIDEVKLNFRTIKLIKLLMLILTPIIIITSNINYSFLSFPRLSSIKELDNGINFLANNISSFREKNILITTEIASLKPNGFSWFDLAFHHQDAIKTKSEIISAQSEADNINPNGIVYFEGGFEEQLANNIIDYYNFSEKNLLLKHNKIIMSVPKEFVKKNKRNFIRLFPSI